MASQRHPGTRNPAAITATILAGRARIIVALQCAAQRAPSPDRNS